ncbi:MAG: urease accessory protein UreD [Elainellaceae cyanobacterium]
MTSRDLASASQTLQTSRPWSGSLQISFARQGTETRISDRRTQAPLKLQRPFYPEGPEVCHSVVLHTAGGIVGGDRLRSQIALHPGAQALMTSAAAGKVYRSAGETASQDTSISIGSGACLEWFPQEIILFNGARYHQQTRVCLEGDAMWMGWDIVRLGRSARGERFETGSWRSLTTVHQGGRLVWVDPVGVNGGSPILSSPAGLNHASVVGTFAAIGRDAPPSLAAACRQVSLRQVQGCGAGGQARGLADFGATRLMSGLLCRYRGHSTAQAKRWFEQVWTLVRKHYWQRPVCRPRIWPR